MLDGLVETAETTGDAPGSYLEGLLSRALGKPISNDPQTPGDLEPERQAGGAAEHPGGRTFRSGSPA
jgi:hypothetical protein